jgi:hypothetical protein
MPILTSSQPSLCPNPHSVPTLTPSQPSLRPNPHSIPTISPSLPSLLPFPPFIPSFPLSLMSLRPYPPSIPTVCLYLFSVHPDFLEEGQSALMSLSFEGFGIRIEDSRIKLAIWLMSVCFAKESERLCRTMAKKWYKNGPLRPYDGEDPAKNGPVRTVRRQGHGKNGPVRRHGGECTSIYTASVYYKSIT